MKLIGFTGKKGHGKTTATLKAIEVLEGKGYKVIRHNFKDALIETVKKKFPETLKQIGIVYDKTIDELFDEKPPVMRALMQNVGTEVYRGMRDDWWVMEWYMKLFQLQKDNETVEKLAIITDDVRFLNEEMMFKAKGGHLIRIIRTGYEDSVATTHQSEVEMDQFIPDAEISAHDKQSLEDNITAYINDHIL